MNLYLESICPCRVPGNSAAVSALVEELNNKGVENVNFQEDVCVAENSIDAFFVC